MRWITLGAQWLLRLTGLFQIVTGFAFWLGYGLELIPTHQTSGMLLVLMLWVLAIVGAFSGASRVLAVVSLLWGALVVWLGLNQMTLLIGGAHWVMRVLHLAVGLAALALGERLARTSLAARRAPAQA
jgi:hypothetical protein